MVSSGRVSRAGSGRSGTWDPSMSETVFPCPVSSRGHRNWLDSDSEESDIFVMSGLLNQGVFGILDSGVIETALQMYYIFEGTLK